MGTGISSRDLNKPDHEVVFWLGGVRSYSVRVSVFYVGANETFFLVFVKGVRVGIYSVDEHLADLSELEETVTGWIFEYYLKLPTEDS